MSRWKIVGISGMTCGGKTTLSNYLLKEFTGSLLICQDDFFLDENSDKHVIVPELNHQNWECLESIDWNLMMERIQHVIEFDQPQENALLLIEGHIIYNYPPLAKLCQIKYFLDLNQEECRKRRTNRTYDPPDPPGYFDLCIWPMFCSNKSVVSNEYKNSIIYIDGTRTVEDIQGSVAEGLRNKLRL